MTKPIRKAVFPVAGLGTRFLPATKAMPKEMLTVVDRPVIQYVVDEAIDAGIEHLVFVTGRNKGVIEDHFDLAFELEATLKSRNKIEAIEILEAALPPPGKTSFTRQQAPLGLGHAVWCARDIVGEEPFALLLPDMITLAEPGCMKQMMTAYETFGGNVIGVEPVPEEETQNYGIVARGDGANNGFEITGMVEKPAPGSAPSNLYIMGRYILQPEIFALLGAQEKGAGNEIQLTDSMLKLMSDQRFTGVQFDGQTFDCGSKIGFLTANTTFGLRRPDLREELLVELRALLGD